MKKRLLYILLMMTAMVAAAHDSYYINNLEPATITAGTTFDVEVSLRNEITYSAAQLDLQLTAGLEVVQDDEGFVCWLSNRTTSNHVLSAFKQEDGSLRLFVTTQNARAITGNDGVLFTVTLRALPGYGAREAITLHHCIAVEEDATKHDLDDVVFNLFETANKFDVNGDGSINVGDVNVVLIEIIAHPDGDGDSKYDVNSDGSVNVGDVNTILAYIIDHP